MVNTGDISLQCLLCCFCAHRLRSVIFFLLHDKFHYWKRNTNGEKKCPYMDFLETTDN